MRSARPPVKRRIHVALCYRCDERDSGNIFYRVIPSGLLCIHGVLRAAGFESRLFNFSGRPWADVRRALARFQPDVVGVSHFTYNHRASVDLFRTVRRICPEALLVAGGPQATFLDELVLAAPLAPDLAVRGEGEVPFLALVEQTHAGRREWTAIPGLSWKDGGEIRRSADPSSAPDLDAFYPIERFTATDGIDPTEQFPFVVTSRGCPANCTFCSSPRFWGRRVRHRGVGNVIAEIRYLMRQYALMYFSIRDDTFTANRQRVLDFSRTVEEAPLYFLWNCQSRVNLVDGRRLLAMKRAGCEQIQFGVESTSPRMLRRLNKATRVEQIAPALAECRRDGIRAGAYFITGIPGQNDADLRANDRLFTEGGLNDGVVSPLCYYPGTALFDEARKQGLAADSIFTAGDPDQLLVRRDKAARHQYDRQVAAIEAFGPKNEFTLEEINAHLERSDRCFSALLDLGRYWERRGEAGRALAAYAEIRHRQPGNPWGYQAAAQLLAALGRHREAEGYMARAQAAAREA